MRTQRNSHISSLFRRERENTSPRRHAVIAGADAERVEALTGVQDMRDIIFVAVTVAFFLISIAYVKFCDRIR